MPLGLKALVYFGIGIENQQQMNSRIIIKGLYTLLILMMTCFCALAQNGTFIGTVKDKETQEAIVGAIVTIDGTTLGDQTDTGGKFRISNIKPGSYDLTVQYIGYSQARLFNLVASNGNANIVSIELERSSQLKEVVVKSYTYGKRSETPLSVQSLTAEEIKSNPGGNYDISRVIQALPGVGGTSGGAARNDLIIRGGAPNENVYYLDGVEVPQINHFSTQGASGGPQGILNISFIQDVTLSTSSFASKYDNALSSVLQFKQKDGNPDKLQSNFRLSSTEIAATLEGPINKKTTFLASTRRSYLQYFFQLIDLPIRPNFWDFQYKVTHKVDDKTTITAIGLGAIDKFSFAAPKNSDLEKEYIIRSLPTINQWNYTVGFTLKRLVKNGYYTVTASRNMFNNQLDKFEDADFGNESKRTFKSKSQEIENKLRLDVNKVSKGWKLNYGLSGQYVKYNNDLFNIVRKNITDSSGNILQPAISINYNSAIDFFKYGIFASVSRRVLNERLLLTAGVRTDMNNYTNDGNNPISALSPRASASYSVTERFNINASVGRYAKIPIYTILGYKDTAGNFVNNDNKYIICDHYVTGIEYLPTKSLRFTLEGFYKQYANYPISAMDGISIANQGAAFGAIGNERTISNGKGRAYGIELFAQQKLVKNLFITASYTLFRSEFTGSAGKYISSSWDARHLLSLIAGYKLPRSWEAGVKYRLSGGAPYTPYDMTLSQLNYLSLGQPIPDYALVNQNRLPLFNQLDIRIDKKINFKKTSLDIYLDFQNAGLSKNVSQDYYTFKRNADNTYATTDGKTVKADGSNAIPVLIPNISRTVIPALGIVFEF
jgi:outer membrane receptor for ferrienterochelin and colicin